MTLKVDTFEHDIADEIRRKEASLAEIQAVSKQNSPPTEGVPQKKLPWFIIILVILLVTSIIGIGAVAYYYFTDSLLPPSAKPLEINKNDVPKVTADLIKLSPTLGSEIGRYISQVEKKETGYILMVNNYSPVFAYMTRNENMYIHELAALFKDPAPLKAPVTATTTEATSTPENSTTTQKTKVTLKENQATTGTTTPVAEDSVFSDLTLDNQNMRIYKKDGETVIYAFVGDKAVLISKTPEGILSLRNAILR